jgi:hypothetical protein
MLSFVLLVLLSASQFQLKIISGKIISSIDDDAVSGKEKLIKKLKITFK